MNRGRAAALLGALGLVALAGCAPPARAPFDGSAAQVGEELGILRAALEEGHPALHRYATAGELDSAFAATAAAAGPSLTLADYQLLVCRLVARVRDGHTRVLLPKDSLDRLDEGPTAFPFKALLADGRLYVHRNYSAVPDREFLGARIVSINDHPVEEFLAAVRAIAPVDGLNETHRLRPLESTRLLTRAYATVYGIAQSYRIAYVPRGDTATHGRTFAGLPFDDVLRRVRERYPANADRPPAALTFDPAAGVAVLRISDFDKDNYASARMSFPTFLDTAFAGIEDRHVSCLILDLRDNRGGTDEYGKLVAAHLIDHPFLYYRTLTMRKLRYDFFAHTTNAKGFRAPPGYARANASGSYDVIQHPNVGVQQPAKQPFRGQLIVLINGACFSTTSELLSAVAEYTSARFVGEESGGANWGNCSGPIPTLELPYSRIRVDIPIVRYEMAVTGGRPPDRGILPDVPVLLTIEDALAGRDPVLERARSLVVDSSTRHSAVPRRRPS